MGIGTSIFLIALGAVLRFAVSLDARIGSTTVNWHIVGDILMVAGVIGLVISMIWMTTARRRTVDEPVARDRVVERDRYVEP